MGITITNVTFVKVLKESGTASVFQVTVQGKTCVLKVYHAIEKSYADPPDREIDTFTCESVAYHRLKMKGLCQQGVVPDFYGVIEQIDPITCQPFLKRFLKDKLRPNAILIEFVPNLQQIDVSTFSEYRRDKFRAILTDIHEVGVYHGDPYPRNLMVQRDTNRVLWIDFDRAQTFSEGAIPEQKLQWMKDEKEMIDEFFEALTEDYIDGKITRTWSYYYEYV